MFKKMLALTLAIATLLCCVAINAVAEDEFRVCVVTSSPLGDMAQTDQMYAGCEAIVAEYPNITFKFIEGSSARSDEWEPNCIAALEGDYDLIFITAASMKKIIKELAPLYPDKKIVATDGLVPGVDNVMSAFFEQNKSSFVNGCLHALMTTSGVEGYNDKKIVGWISALENPTVMEYYMGYEAGVHYIDPEIQVLFTLTGSFSDPTLVKEAALAMYSQGADIIHAQCAAAGAGLYEAVQEVEGWVTCDGENYVKSAGDKLAACQDRNAQKFTYEIIKSVYEDRSSFVGGGIYYLNFANGGAGESHYNANVPQEVIDRINEIIEQINSGELKVVENPDLRS